MKSSLIAACLIFVSTSVVLAEESVGQLWENSLLTQKRHGTLAGPRPGQKCLWSARLNGCLWYTPGRWNLNLRN